MRALNLKLVRDIAHLRGQAIAVAIVVACGIATYVTMHSAYDAILTSQQAYYRGYRFADVFARLKRAPEETARRIEQIPGVASVQTRVVLEVTLDVPGLGEPALARVISMPESRGPILNDVYLRRGRFFAPGRDDEVVASQAFAEANKLPVGSFIGAVINGRWKRLQIVGIGISPEYIYEVGGGAILPDRKRFGILWMSRRVLGPAYNMEGAFNDVSLALLPRASEREVVAQLDHILEPYGGYGAHGRGDQFSHHFLSNELAKLRVSGTITPLIFLGVAAFLIHTVLSRLVQTQREQIAILKAFGYTTVDIGLHYLGFAVAIIIAGTIAGTLLGTWFASGLAGIYAAFYQFPAAVFDVRFDRILGAALISAVAAFIGALWSVRAAVRLPPAVAMRPEPPRDFHAGLIERMGLLDFFSPAGRIVVRNMTRRKMKVLLSAIGIAFAVAIIIVGLGPEFSLDELGRIQFRSIQREHLAVNFVQPRTIDAVRELAHAPGVLRVEPSRTVAVRLRAGHRSRRTTIIGLDHPNTLRRLLSKSGRPVDLAEGGIVLTEKLAEVLAVKAGDRIRVEVLEGNRPRVDLPVTRISHEWLGIAAYADRRIINNLMREPSVATGAYLLVDERLLPRLYDQLKKTPEVSGVAIREVMLESFEKTVAETLRVSTMILTLFACAIALAVVYNSARIALSERGRELASLRVLGFTQKEVSTILFGEQAAITIVAIPFGCVLGHQLCVLIANLMNTELARLPVVPTRATFGYAILVIAASAVIAAILVIRRIRRLDLVEVLKARE